ncbi:unnamed protein product, partial [Pocillopora meandrina]
TPRPERRRSLLIYGADRSGTTFTTKMFAEDPQLMTVYEPLWITTKWNKEDSSQIPNWTKNVLDLLRGILSCKFAETAAGVKFLAHTSRQWNGAYVKNPFQSQNFCPNWECKDLSSTPTYADTVCLTKYKHSVTKIGEPRTPNSLISSFLPKVFLENPDTDIRVIQLIRDPRASLRSRIRLGWMVDWTHWNFRKLVRKVCSNLVANIKFGRNLGKWQDRYLEVHYHDLAGKPLETTRAMYDFAGFEMSDSIADWVVRNTSPSKEELMKESKNKFSPTRNSTANIDKWKQDSPSTMKLIIIFLLFFLNFYSQFRGSFSDPPTGGEMNVKRNTPFRICKKFCFPCAVLLLFSSAVVLHNSHYGQSLFNYSKELIKPNRSLTQNKTALVTLLTNPNKPNSPEVVRAWADVNSASSEVQKSSRPKISTGSKPALEAQPIHRVQPAPSEIKTGLNQKPQSEARSTSDVHSVSSGVRPKKDQEDRSPSEVFLENPDTDIRVIQLIRDPRASFRSRIKLRWMVDWTHRNFRKLVRKVCSNLVANIKFGRNLGKWQDKYLEVHYHDLAGKPLETTRAMYNFAGFEMPDSIADWVVRNTSPSKEELMKESKNIFSPTRNSTANIDKWKRDSPVERIRIIEEYCQEALDLLGLKKMP